MKNAIGTHFSIVGNYNKNALLPLNYRKLTGLFEYLDLFGIGSYSKNSKPITKRHERGHA